MEGGEGDAEARSGGLARGVGETFGVAALVLGASLRTYGMLTLTLTLTLSLALTPTLALALALTLTLIRAPSRSGPRS